MYPDLTTPSLADVVARSIEFISLTFANPFVLMALGFMVLPRAIAVFHMLLGDDSDPQPASKPDQAPTIAHITYSDEKPHRILAIAPVCPQCHEIVDTSAAYCIACGLPLRGSSTGITEVLPVTGDTQQL